MCVIVLKPVGKSLSEEEWEACWLNNPDGWGIMYAERGEVHVIKSMDNNEFLPTLAQLRGLPVGIHFRWRTHGDKDLFNVHPYPVLTKAEHGVDLYMMHNGVIRIEEIDKTKSDTWHYIEFYLRPILSRAPTLIEMPEFRDMIAEHIGSSKLMFLGGNGEFHLVNKKLGTEVSGCWLSNSYSHHGTRFRASQAATSVRGYATRWDGGAARPNGTGTYYDYDQSWWENEYPASAARASQQNACEVPAQVPQKGPAQAPAVIVAAPAAAVIAPAAPVVELTRAQPVTPSHQRAEVFGVEDDEDAGDDNDDIYTTVTTASGGSVHFMNGRYYDEEGNEVELDELDVDANLLEWMDKYEIYDLVVKNPESVTEFLAENFSRVNVT